MHKIDSYSSNYLIFGIFIGAIVDFVGSVRSLFVGMRLEEAIVLGSEGENGDRGCHYRSSRVK